MLCKLFSFKSIVNELYSGLTLMVWSLWKYGVFLIVERSWSRQNFFSSVFDRLQSKTDDWKPIVNPKQNFRDESDHLGCGFLEWKSFFFQSQENPLYFMFWRSFRILFLKIVFPTFPMILKTFSHLFFIVKKHLNESSYSFFIFGKISETQLDLYLQGILFVFSLNP